MKILVTGGAGFIGSHTVRRLHGLGHTCVILDSLHPQIHTSDPQRSPTWRSVRELATAFVSDIRDVKALSLALSGCEAVLHLAAETGTGQSMYEIERYVGTNVGGSAALLEGISRSESQIRRVVIASSRSVYGEGSYHCASHGVLTPDPRVVADLQRRNFEPQCPHCRGALRLTATRENASLRPASVYAVTKLAQEQLVATVCNAIKIPWFALRYQNVYGPGQSLNNPYTGVLSIFSRLMLERQPLEIFEDGNESRDFVFIDDVVEANVAALTAPAKLGGVVNVGSGKGTSILELVRLLATHYGYEGEVSVTGRFRAGDIRHNIADVSAAATLLGLRSATRIEDGIASFCRWAKLELSRSQAASADYRQSLAELESRGLID